MNTINAPRLPSPEQVFLTHPKNAPFIFGASARPVVVSGVTPLLLVFLALFLGCALAWNAQTLRDVGREIEFLHSNIAATATITDRNISFRRPATYSLAYTYHDGLSARESVDRATYERLRPGMQVQVRYATTNPAIVHIEGRSAIWPQVLAALVGIAFVGLGSWTLLQAIKLLRSDRRMRSEGRVIPGTLIDARLNLGWKGRVSLATRYSFVSPTSGKKIRGVVQRQRRDLHSMALPPPGALLAILYVDDTSHTAL